MSGGVFLPMVPHAMFALFPMAAVHHSASPAMSVAFGPFLLLTREAYCGGGPRRAADSIVDDVELSKHVKAAGGSVRLANGTDLVETGWYGSRGGTSGRGSPRTPSAAWGTTLGRRRRWCSCWPRYCCPVLPRGGGGRWTGNIPAIAVWQVLLLLSNRMLTSRMGATRSGPRPCTRSWSASGA